MKIGFIGTGAITTAMVEGLCQADHLPADIVVSPRNMKKAEKLAARFDNVRIAGNNQVVADECDCVVLAVIPQIAQSVLGELHFRRKQKIISVTALIAPYYALMESVCRWGVASGMDSKASGNYVGSMFQALSVLAREASADCFENLSAEASTPGGLNEQALKEIRKQDGFDAFTKALDAVLARLNDKSTG